MYIYIYKRMFRLIFKSPSVTLTIHNKKLINFNLMLKMSWSRNNQSAYVRQCPTSHLNCILFTYFVLIIRFNSNIFYYLLFKPVRSGLNKQKRLFKGRLHHIILILSKKLKSSLFLYKAERKEEIEIVLIA